MPDLTTLADSSNHRAIATQNLALRALPTNMPAFYNYTFAGQGYPFDNLQVTSVWYGTPLYVFTTTKDHAWSFVATPATIGWVKSADIAYAKPAFIKAWQYSQKLAVVTQTDTPLNIASTTTINAYVGTVLPSTAQGHRLLAVVRDRNGNARLKTTSLPNGAVDQSLTQRPPKIWCTLCKH